MRRGYPGISKNKMSFSQKMQSIRFSSMKINRNAVKIIVFDGITEISTVEIELLLAFTDNMGHNFST